jgi:hypothetical protein
MSSHCIGRYTIRETICDLRFTRARCKTLANCAQINRASASVWWTSTQRISMDSEFSKQSVLISMTLVLKNVRHTGIDLPKAC